MTSVATGAAAAIGPAARNVQPIATADAARNAASPQNAQKLRQAAEDFAAVALGELLSPMFDTVDTANGLFGGTAGEAAFKPMLVAEMGKQIARSGGLGLVEPIYQQMLRMQEGRR
jgi:Rod binding domain-containing protein